LVPVSGSGGDAAAIASGTAFLTQMQNDCSALLNALLEKEGDNPAITAAINNDIVARFLPAFLAAQAGGGPVTFGIVWFDPVSINLQAPQNQQASYSPAANQALNAISQTYINVGGNIEVVVVADRSGSFQFGVGNVADTARGGAVVLAAGQVKIESFTDALRAGTKDFTLTIPPSAIGLGPGLGGGGGGGEGGNPLPGAGNSQLTDIALTLNEATTSQLQAELVTLLATGVLPGPTSIAATTTVSSDAAGKVGETDDADTNEVRAAVQQIIELLKSILWLELPPEMAPAQPNDMEVGLPVEAPAEAGAAAKQALPPAVAPAASEQILPLQPVPELPPSEGLIESQEPVDAVFVEHWSIPAVPAVEVAQVYFEDVFASAESFDAFSWLLAVPMLGGVLLEEEAAARRQP
jgi:hypothetical protein